MLAPAAAELLPGRPVAAELDDRLGERLRGAWRHRAPAPGGGDDLRQRRHVAGQDRDLHGQSLEGLQRGYGATDLEVSPGDGEQVEQRVVLGDPVLFDAPGED